MDMLDFEFSYRVCSFHMQIDRASYVRFDGSFEVANVTVFSKAVTIEEGTISGHSPHTTPLKHACYLN